MRLAAFVAAVAAAVLLPLACEPGAGGLPDGGGGTDSSSYDASDPATGRWFGTIFVDTKLDTSGTTTPGPGLRIQKTHVERAHTRIDISPDGHRHSATTYRILDDQISDNNQGCILIHGVNTMNETAKNASDAGSYFALSADGDNGYKSGEFPGGFAFTPTQPFVSHNRMTLDQCGYGTIQTSNNPESPTVAGILPFDHVKGTLSPDRRNANGAAQFDFNGVHYSMRWSLQRDNEIVAVVDDQTVARVSTVHLDGSQSRGTIDTYDWTITPDDDWCSGVGVPELDKKLQVGKEVKPSGKTYDFPILCDVYAELSVTGPAGNSKATGWIEVTPRSWKVETNESDGKNRKSYTTSSALGAAALAGSNRCAVESGALSGHFIHTTTPKKYDGSAFAVSQLDANGDGPFAGGYYLDSPSIVVKRTELVSVDYALASGTAYQETAKKNASVAAMLDEQISAHEAAHSKFVFDLLDDEAGGPNDPALRVEALIADNSADLTEVANESLYHDNEDLCLASSHSYVTSYLAGLPNSDASTWNGAAQICYQYCDPQTQVCSPICAPVAPFYSTAFDDSWCVAQ